MDSQASKKGSQYDISHRNSGGAEKGDMIPAVSISVIQESDRRNSGCSSDDDQAPQVPLLKKLVYGSVSFSTVSLSLLIGAYGNDFYVQMGALLPIISLFTALARSFDIVTDLSMAWFSDNFRSKYGRRRPFMAAGCIPYGVMFFLFFTPPGNLGSFGISVYYGIFYILFYLGDTVSTVPYDALGPELSSDYKERNTIFFITRLFQIGGSVVASTMPALLQTFFSSQGWSQIASARVANTVTAGFFATWYIASTMICVATIKERPLVEEDAKGAAAEVPLVPSLLRGFRNPAIRSLILAWVMDGLQAAVLVTLFPFYIRYFIQPDGPAAIANGLPFLPATFIGVNIALLFISAAVATPFWLLLAQRLGKFEAWILFNVLSTVTNLLFLLPREGQTGMVMIVMFINGLPGGGIFLNNSIMADVIDYEEFLHGARSEGAFSVYATLVNKTVAIPGSAIPLGILSMIGFVYPINGEAQAQPASVVNFLYLGITTFTVVCSVVSFLSKMQFPIKKLETVAVVQAGVRSLAGGHTAADPVTGKVICRPQLDAEEKELYWLLENFGSRGWASITAASGDVTALLNGARLRTLISTAVSGCAGFAALYSLFFLVTDPKWSIFATLAVITAVFSLCWTFVYISGWVDAKKLSHVNGDKLVRLVGKLHRCSGMQGAAWSNTNQ